MGKIMSLETISAFVIASILLSLAPGPDNVFVLTQSALKGKLAGIMVSLGLCTGLIVHTTAVAFGSIALLAGHIGTFITRSNKIQKVMNWTAGIVFIFIAVWLAGTEL